MRITVNTLTLLVITACFSSQTFANLAQYVHVRESVFWQQLYTQNYHTLYCAIHKKAGEKVNIAHVYPTAWMANAMRCSSEEDCDFARYRDASSDLHNLWPMISPAKDIRRHYIFLEGDKEKGQRQDCNMIVYPKGIEPREWAKGEIARSLLYIIWKYDLPDYEQLDLLLKWHKKYPANAEEKWRNDKIIAIQGNDNPFISAKHFEQKAFPNHGNAGE
ncbi:MAG: endonuclease [Aestuariibacter sp.]